MGMSSGSRIALPCLRIECRRMVFRVTLYILCLSKIIISAHRVTFSTVEISFQEP